MPVEREIQEIDDLFAKAHEEMDNIQKLFACCEAMVCYGFQREAQLIAEKLTFELFNKPPKLIFDVTARAPKVQQGKQFGQQVLSLNVNLFGRESCGFYLYRQILKMGT